MTMHLEGPWLSMGGKRKGKTKFRNSSEAQKARQLDSEWRELQAKWGVEADEKKRKRALSAEPLQYTLSAPVGRSTSNHIPSRNTGEAGAITYKANPQYTGTKVLGVTIVHKSCLQPVFNQQEAVDAASMRR
jgi:hypothetical protein